MDLCIASSQFVHCPCCDCWMAFTRLLLSSLLLISWMTRSRRSLVVAVYHVWMLFISSSNFPFWASKLTSLKARFSFASFIESQTFHFLPVLGESFTVFTTVSLELSNIIWNLTFPVLNSSAIDLSGNFSLDCLLYRAMFDNRISADFCFYCLNRVYGYFIYEKRPWQNWDKHVLKTPCLVFTLQWTALDHLWSLINGFHCHFNLFEIFQRVIAPSSQAFYRFFWDSSYFLTIHCKAYILMHFSLFQGRVSGLLRLESHSGANHHFIHDSESLAGVRFFGCEDSNIGHVYL